MEVTDGSDVTQATFGYDARNHRVTKGVYVSGSLDHTRHYYHSEENQVVEERIDSSSDPDRQYTWGDTYTDDLVLRTRDTDSNGSLDETVYALHDSNWNVTALADTSGTVVERFRYDAHGRSAVLDASFADDADGVSDYLWEHRFTSREWDVESGLHYFRARYYDEATGRFLQRDSIGYVSGMNAYAGYFVPNDVDPSGHVTKQECEKAKSDAQRAFSGVRKGMKANKCKLPRVRCKSCSPNDHRGAYGYFNPDTVLITICYNRMNNYTVRQVAMVIMHELTHAYDNCMGADPDDCYDRACSEVRAYSYSGQCDVGEPARRGKTREECVKDEATRSVNTISHCNPGRQYVEAVFDDCYCKEDATGLPAWPR